MQFQASLRHQHWSRHQHHSPLSPLLTNTATRLALVKICTECKNFTAFIIFYDSLFIFSSVINTRERKKYINRWSHHSSYKSIPTHTDVGGKEKSNGERENNFIKFFLMFLGENFRIKKISAFFWGGAGVKYFFLGSYVPKWEKIFSALLPGAFMKIGKLKMMSGNSSWFVSYRAEVGGKVVVSAI